jgi:hypothetical protein
MEPQRSRERDAGLDSHRQSTSWRRLYESAHELTQLLVNASDLSDARFAETYNWAGCSARVR